MKLAFKNCSDLPWTRIRKFINKHDSIDFLVQNDCPSVRAVLEPVDKPGTGAIVNGCINGRKNHNHNNIIEERKPFVKLKRGKHIMKIPGYIDRQNKLITFFAGMLALAFVLAGCSSSSSPAPTTTTPATVTVSGKVTSTANPSGESGVAVEGVYSTPGATGNATATTNTSGDFTLTVETNRAVYVRFSKTGFVILNSEKGSLDTNETGADIELPTPAEVQPLLEALFSTTLVNHAWLAVDVTDANDNEVNNESITSVPAVTAEVYTECDGSDSLGNVTTGAPCLADRDAPMYIGYFDATADVQVSAAPTANDTKIAPVRMGEITFVDFD